MRIWGIIAALAIATGCGRWGFGDDDENVVDPPANAGDVDVVVFNGGAPRQGQSIVFHDVDGQVIDLAVTGPDGTATGQIPPGGMVSVVELYVKDDELYANIDTIAGVDPGESLTFGSLYDPWQGAGEIDISYAAPIANATWYGVSAGCSFYTTAAWDDSIDYEAGVNCASGGRVALLAGGYDDSDNLLGYSYLTDVQVSPSAIEYVDMPAWSTAMSTIDVSVSDIPGAGAEIELMLQPTVDGVGIQTFYDETFAAGTTANLSVDVPSGLADGYNSTIAIWTASGGTAMQRNVTTETASIEHSLAAALPSISEVSVRSGAETARPDIVVSGGSLSADAALYEVYWDGVEAHVSWYILAPPDATGMTLPALPDFYSNIRPTSSDDLGEFSVQSAHIDASFATDFADIIGDYGMNILDPYFYPSSDYELFVSFGPDGPPGNGEY